jgi:Zn-dependent protease with chaperone function
MTLGYLARGLIQALSAHLIVSTVLSVAVAALWPMVVEGHASAVATARRLFLLRLAPALGGLVTAALVLVAYGLWEARVDAEPVGAVALAAAAGGSLLIGAALIRATLALRHTWRVQRALARAAEGALPSLPLPACIVNTRFPVVAVVGLVVPRLFVARRVLDTCTADEFEAVVAHEQAHARAHDNLRRLAMTAAPDAIGLLPAGRRWHDAWATSAELAADEWAARRASNGLHLAAALVKVARLATTPAPPLPASALFEGEPIAARVHRLLDPPHTPDASPTPRWRHALTVALLLAAAAASLPALHAAAERILKLGL